MSNSPADLEIEVRQLRDRVRLLEAMVRHSKDLLFTLDTEDRITGLNETAERALQWSERELIGTRLEDLIDSVDSGQAYQTSTFLKTQTGNRLAVEIRRERHIIVAHDLAERSVVEDNLRQAQKMETLGVLAGGIAHDFNNLLTGILGYAYLLQNEPDLVERFGEGIEVIVKSSERAAQLTTQLLGFARQKSGPLTPVDLHLTIHEVVQLLHRTIDRKIRVSAHLAASHCHATADAIQMYQILLNLCLNARDAMPDGGQLKITSKNSGGSIVISVSDTGGGISEEIRGRIFEPFFTTKTKNRGTGMGLAMVRAIARNHGGAVSLESELGKGSTFHVTLPVSAYQECVQTSTGESLSGAGHILIIEDEQYIRQVLTRMLHGMGYEVSCASDVRAGLDYYRTHHNSVDLVILDLMMPAMNGLEALTALRAVDPQVKAVLSSGYGAGQENLGDIEFLAKPYQPEQLAKVVRRAMAAQKAL